MSYSHRIFIYGPVGLLLLIVLLYWVFGRVTADTLSAELDRANGGEVIPGIDFAFADKTVGGFPFRLDVVLSGVTLAHRGPDGETAWRTERLALHMQSYDAGHFIFEADGLQSFAWPRDAGQPPRVLYITPAIARASAILQHGELTRFDIDYLGLQLKEATLGVSGDRSFTATRAQLHLLGQPDKSIAVALKVDDAKIGAGFRAAARSRRSADRPARKTDAGPGLERCAPRPAKHLGRRRNLAPGAAGRAGRSLRTTSTGNSAERNFRSTVGWRARRRQSSGHGELHASDAQVPELIFKDGALSLAPASNHAANSNSRSCRPPALTGQNSAPAYPDRLR